MWKSKNYKIVRFRRNPKTEEVTQRTIKTGLTKAEAKEHCNREDTHGENWFDGFAEIGGK